MGQNWFNESMYGSWDVYLASPTDFFAGADDITKERAWNRDHL